MPRLFSKPPRATKMNKHALLAHFQGCDGANLLKCFFDMSISHVEYITGINRAVIRVAHERQGIQKWPYWSIKDRTHSDLTWKNVKYHRKHMTDKCQDPLLKKLLIIAAHYGTAQRRKFKYIGKSAQAFEFAIVQNKASVEEREQNKRKAEALDQPKPKKRRTFRAMKPDVEETTRRLKEIKRNTPGKMPGVLIDQASTGPKEFFKLAPVPSPQGVSTVTIYHILPAKKIKPMSLPPIKEDPEESSPSPMPVKENPPRHIPTAWPHIPYDIQSVLLDTPDMLPSIVETPFWGDE